MKSFFRRVGEDPPVPPQPAPAHTVPNYPAPLPTEMPQPGKAKTCKRCGDYFRSRREFCNKCTLADMREKEPKRHGSKYPCSICGTTHSSQWAMTGFTVARQSRQVPVCEACQEIRNRNLGAAMGRDIYELWLDIRAGELLGVAQRWLGHGTYRTLHGLVRHLLRMPASDYDRRPMLAHELPSYAPTDEDRDPLHWLPLNTARAALYRKGYEKARVLLASEGHPGSGTTIPLSPEVDQYSRILWAVGRERGIDLEAAAQVLADEGVETVGLVVKPSPRLLAAALAYAHAAGP